jgi:hypothetical protein
MTKETTGIIVDVKKQWWLKINTKAFRKHSFDGAIFPHIIKVEYVVDNKTYTIKKWISAYEEVPAIGSCIKVKYEENKPEKGEI